ncbi:methyl-accepting chemotaxis protein [Chamaesiphon sp. OTE_20_metabat_361]|nr:methyl-accepting chemotaxis protein [Chamaesiphon sp. OTE_20_metabat_361]
MLSNFKTNFQSKFNNLTFKTRAIGTVVLLSVLPVATVGGLAYFASYDSLKKVETENQQLATGTLADALTRFISIRSKDAQALASSPLFDNQKISKGLTIADKEAYLNDYLARYTFFDGAEVLDLKGDPIAFSKKNIKTNYAGQIYFKNVLKTGKPFISSVEISKVTKAPSIFFAAPVKDNVTGQLIGILCLRMPVASLKSIAEPYATNSNEWHIIDKNTNKFVLALEENQVGRSTSDFSEYERLKNSTKPQSTFDVDRVDNQQQLISVLSLPKTEELGASNLGVILSKDKAIIDAKESSVLLILALGMLTTGAVTIGLSLLLGNRITKFIQQLADSIANSTGTIVDTVEMQEVTVNMQANSAIDTSKTVNELGAISFQSAAQAEASANGARQALSLSEDGTRAVQQTLQGMTGLRDKVDAIASQIVNLSEQTGQITVVSDLVADLASQTNMLALNAAVEAARAGEQGRGFSVVADEIRKLADQSKKSADKINALADDIQSAINRTVMVTDEGTKTVNEGIDLAQATAATFAGVTDAVNNVFLNSQQISTSAKQQAVSIQQVLSSMTNISQGSQESAIGMHQVKMTTKELTQVADELKAAVV